MSKNYDAGAPDLPSSPLSSVPSEFADSEEDFDRCLDASTTFKAKSRSMHTSQESDGKVTAGETPERGYEDEDDEDDEDDAELASSSWSTPQRDDQPNAHASATEPDRDHDTPQPPSVNAPFGFIAVPVPPSMADSSRRIDEIITRRKKRTMAKWMEYVQDFDREPRSGGSSHESESMKARRGALLREFVDETLEDIINTILTRKRKTSVHDDDSHPSRRHCNRRASVDAEYSD